VTVAITGVIATRGRRGTITLDGDHIVSVTEGDAAPAGARDVGDALLAPGFVDLQVNGNADVDFGSSDAASITAALCRLGAQGTTACLPTLVSAPLRRYDGLLDTLRAARDDDGGAAGPAASILGVHLEGPFLGGAPGAHPRDVLIDVDIQWIDQLLQRHGDLVRMVTLAPEADPEHIGSRAFANAGVVVALGHSACSFADAVEAADAGARVVTHLFNGMSGLHHRNPGLAAAALLDERLTPTIIPDLIHVHPALLRLAHASKPDIVAVSDAVAPGAGESGGLRVVEREGAVYLDDGTLAGSVLTMAGALRNLVGIGVPLADAVAMTSTRPADLVGATDRGRLLPGARADIVLLDPDELAVREVLIGGVTVEAHR
jgi:N-acetylglucosamine-6-phosphate deacetylase